MGETMSLAWTIPFVGILLSIALMPLLMPHFWHHHFEKIAVAWSVVFLVPFLFVYRSHAIHSALHIMLLDYVPFVILLLALFTISGGILVRGTLVGTPGLNTGLLAIGTVIASWIGTTGASMVLIRPLLRANANRRYRVHTVVFFIFLVSNVGGLLTPLGDPPLFLGFLHHVPFFWTLIHLWPAFLFLSILLLGIYWRLDWFWYRREDAEVKVAPVERVPIRVVGLANVPLLVGVVGAVLLSGAWRPTAWHAGSIIQRGELMVLGSHEEPPADHHGNAHPADEANHAGAADHAETHGLGIPIQNLARDLILLALVGISLMITDQSIRRENGFNWGPIAEIAWLFAAIFLTIIPALAILQAGEKGALAPLVAFAQEPMQFFWITGILSSFLDNAPTYLTFFNTALGRFFPELVEGGHDRLAVARLIAEKAAYLKAISMGAVFMGANTYIGNAPNFMVRSIAEEAGVRMPDFFSYIYKYSLPILGSLFVVVSLVFFRG